MSQAVVIPYKPREWAKQLHGSLRRWGVYILHRRAGKTTAVLNHHLRAAADDAWERRRLLSLAPNLTSRQVEELVHPPGGRHYGHVMPYRTQAKLVAWDKLKHYAQVIPKHKFNESELLVRLPNGNKVQLFGADDPDSFRGFAGSGLSFDEYSQQPQNIFSEVLSKALGDHLGYALFLGTIKGKDHLYRTYEAGKDSEAWSSLWQDIDRSLATEEGVTIQLLEQAMADDRELVRQGLMTQDEFDQEWYLSTEAAIKGAFYGDEMAAALKAGRITRVPYDPALPVDTDWDLGIDAMAVWFSQSERSGSIRLIDYHEDVGGGLAGVIKVVKEKPYIYGEHWAPHDIEVREISSGLTRKQSAASLGINFKVTPRIEVEDGINAAKLTLARCWFDNSDAKLVNGVKQVGIWRGIECLRQYRKTFNTRLEAFTAVPVHNWASHGADAFRGLSVRHQVPKAEKAKKQAQFPKEYAWS